MTIQATDFQTLHDYAQGVMKRATHHAGNVSAIALALLGEIIWNAQPGSVKIKQYDGDLGNVLWWESINGKKYACAYNHQTQEIEIRDQNIKGNVLHRFSNSTPLTNLEQVFATI